MKRSKLCGVAAMLLICTFVTNGYAQSESLSMTLEECLDYAKQNSITLQKAQLQIDNTVADQLSAKGSFLPTVSGSVSQSLNSNPLSDESNSAYYSGSYGVDLSLNLYNGGRNKAQLEQSAVGYNIASLEFEEFVNSIEVAVTEVYIEILYAIEQIAVAESSLELSEKNEARGRVLLDVGSINSVELAQLESATATDRYDVVVAKAQLSNLYVSLKHLLEISPEVSISIIEPEISGNLQSAYIPPMREVYDAAVNERPEILATQLYVTSAEYDVAIAKSGFLPTLSFTAGTGISHNSGSDYTFSNQLRENFTTSAGLRLSVPIFSNYSNRSSLIKSQNSLKTASLSLSEAEKDLYQTIETLHNNAITAQAKYTVSDVQLKATKRSMELTNQQYEVGLKNIIEMLTEQDNYNQAYQTYLINKYQFIYNNAILNYYKTNIIKL